MESLVPEPVAMPDEGAKVFLCLALTSGPAREFLKKERGLLGIKSRKSQQNQFFVVNKGVCSIQ